MSIHKNLLGATIALAAMTAPALADNYSASTWLPTNSSVPTGYNALAERLEAATNGDISFDIFVGGALLPARETLQGVGRGVAAMGQITTAYTPADLPLNNVIGDLGFLTKHATIGSFAATEVRFNNAALLGEWDDHNIVFSGSFSTPTYVLQCTSPVATLADAKGKKVRASLGAQVDFLAGIGAIPVSVPGSDIYSGLERGSIDCSLLARDSLISLKMNEVVTDVTELKMGVFLGGATWGFNKDFWQDLTPENRRILLDEVAVALVDNTIFTNKLEERAIAETKAMGTDFITPEAGLQSALDEFNSSFLENLPARSMEKRSIDDPTDLINDYLAAQEKWTKLLIDVDLNDQTALMALVKAEIFDKLDVNTFGMD